MTVHGLKSLFLSIVVLILTACGGGSGSTSSPQPSTPADNDSQVPAAPSTPVDTVAPVLTLNGDAFITLTLGDTFYDPSASALDDVDGVLNVTISDYDLSSVGNYTVTYSATDAAGNTSSVTRTVVIEAAVTQTQDQSTFTVLDNGVVSTAWSRGIQAFDQALDYADCDNLTTPCQSLLWEVVTDTMRGEVLQVTHTNGAQLAGLFFGTDEGVNLAEFSSGSINFDIKIISGDPSITFKLDCFYPCTSGDVALGAQATGEWLTVSYPLADLVSSGLDLSNVNTGLVIWASQFTDTVFHIDNVFFSTSDENAVVPESDASSGDFTNFTALTFGAGSVSNTINPNSYRCVFDYGNWIYNAGIVEPGISGCDTDTETPLGSPTPLFPQVSGAAAEKPVASARWWGSVSFLGEMTLGDPNDAAYITPDPITARITNTGVRMMGIPAGLRTIGENDFMYQIPDPFAEVMDGLAVGNSIHANLEATLKDSSDGSVTVGWHSGVTEVMQATFIQGSPHVFFDVYSGELELRTLREDGGEKGIFYQAGNSIGVWTSVAGNKNHYVITGDEGTLFTNIDSSKISASSSTNAFTVTLMPATNADPSAQQITDFLATARNPVASVTIDYRVNRGDNRVSVTHRYLDENGLPVITLAGLQPLHWKNTTDLQSNHSVRSARGITKFSELSEFTYNIPFIGLIPTLPALADDLDVVKATELVNEFMALGQERWNDSREDAYWSGKNYSKIAELIGLADQLGLAAQKATLLAYLKAELTDWFTAESDGVLDEQQYFAYDEQWNTLLSMEESFASHQQLNDHHFHYGYLVRAAAEVCRFDIDWCGDDEYGPMIELLIRDYAAGRDDDMFPYLRHFDPANGFSWASGRVNFVRGNNNESTSEAANAYGAMILYGLLTNNDDIADRGIYLHASTAAAYWEYWNNIDGYETSDPAANNFPDGYNRLTTSIIWGDGAAFSTWFSPAFAHILGIQGLPANTLSLHIGQYPDYLVDYVALGLSESGNGKPSGLIADQWRDIWWKIWALTDADGAFADYDTAADYIPEAGETKAHTYYWLKQMQTLGHIGSSNENITADYPGAMLFTKGSTRHYVVYNYSTLPLTVSFSDGVSVMARPQTFTTVTQ